MDREALAAVVLSVACLAGIGMASSTLKSAVQTTPDDAIDLDGAGVPLGSGEREEYRNRLQSGSNRPASDGDPTSAPTSGESEERSQRRADGGDLSGPSDPQGDGQADTSGGDGRADSGEGNGLQSTVPSLLDKLLAFLRWLLGVLLSLLPLLLALAAVAAFVVRRERIATFLRERFGREPGNVAGGGTEMSGQPAPSNEVAAAWHDLVSLVGVEDRETKTPRECATLAVERGVARSAVEAVTEPFEEVRYGGAPVSPDRRERATKGLQRARADYRKAR